MKKYIVFNFWNFGVPRLGQPQIENGSRWGLRGKDYGGKLIMRRIKEKYLSKKKNIIIVNLKQKI